MSVFLKVKIKSLAAEAAIIRREERKAIKAGRWHRWRDKQDQLNTDSEKQVTHYRRHGSLHHHRTVDVRSEARAAQIAYAFLRGRELRPMEGGMRNAPRWDRVIKLVQRYYVGDDKKEEVRLNLIMWAAKAGINDDLLTF